MMLCSIREEIPKNQQKRPVALMIPVNLRNYFPSQSMTNFFGWIEVGYIFSDETTFEDVLLSVKKQFEEELVKEKIAMHMSGYVRIEKNPFVRAVPLEIKKYFLMIGANLGSRSITAVYSNIGIIRLPEEYKEYIQHFGIFASTNSLQMCSCSYGDEMVLGFTSKIPDDSIQRNFQRMLGEENVSHRELKNEFPGYGEKHRLEKKENQKVIQTFSFLCLAIAVICGMINFMMAGVLNWFWFAGAGCACAWLVVMVAYYKRRNILKNEMWQLLLISVIAILWDRVYRMEVLVCGFCDSFRDIGSAVFCSCDCKNKPSGKGRISVLSCTGRNCRTDSDDIGLDWNRAVCRTFSNLCRNQFSDIGCTVYLLQEGYDAGVS